LAGETREAESEIEEAEERIARAIDAVEGDNPREALERIEKDVPDTFDDVIDEYTEAIKEAREFTGANELATIPDSDVLKIDETPEHLQPLVPFAGYFEPAPFSGNGDEDTKPRYYLTPSAEAMKQHNRAEIRGTAVSEFYPGHHLQQVVWARNASKLSVMAGRFNAFGDDFVEGWMDYAAERAVEAGYGDETVELSLARDRIEAACRAIVDVKLQTGEMSIRDAAGFLADEGGVEQEVALAEVKSFTENPGGEVSRLVGARMLRELKEDIDMKERDFHDTLLEGGGVP
ncbi:MAG: DUF885 family protein, partial [Halobacteria archaeon]|nr:DUF885 family protein [Halobacteria archaeon]